MFPLKQNGRAPCLALFWPRPPAPKACHKRPSVQKNSVRPVHFPALLLRFSFTVSNTCKNLQLKPTDNLYTCSSINTCTVTLTLINLIIPKRYVLNGAENHLAWWLLALTHQLHIGHDDSNQGNTVVKVISLF